MAFKPFEKQKKGEGKDAKPGKPGKGKFPFPPPAKKKCCAVVSPDETAKATPPAVLVVWEDAYAPDVGDTWVQIKPTVWEPCLVSSVGFLIYDGVEGIVLVESFRKDFTGQRQQLPRGMIRSVQYLTPKKGSNARPTT